MYRWLLRPLLFRLSPEVAHRVVMVGLAFVSRLGFVLRLLAAWYGSRDPRLRVRAFGAELASPVGIAAGLDKDGEAFAALGAFGFGFVEVGTLTPRPQPGSPRPRLFRLPRDRALINRMGFNNCGAERAAEHLARTRPTSVLGVNIGKNKDTANDDAASDYVQCARLLGQHADYVVVNVSSPNTPQLRALQAVEQLRPLLQSVKAALASAAAPARVPPLLLKISPDLADAEVDAIADLARELELDGIIATNTTISRAGLNTDPHALEQIGAGGLSGAPLAARSLAVLKRLRQRLGDRLVLISVGGITSAEDAWQRVLAGATLVQVYTSLIYEGPGIAHELNAGLLERALAAGYPNVQAAIGAGVPQH